MSQSNNFLLGNPGTAGQSNTIVIGNTQTKTYCSGIYNKSVNSSPMQLVVNSSNQLGVTATAVGAGTYSFLYYLSANVPNVTGDASIYYLGSTVTALTSQYDNTSGNFNPGTGSGGTRATAAYFQAPATGHYFLTYALYATIPINTDVAEIVINIETWTSSTLNYSYSTYLSNDPFLGTAGYINSIIIDMTSGDQAYFNVFASPDHNPKDLSILGGGSPYNTYISGFRIN